MADEVSQRRAIRPGESTEPRIERQGQVWRIRSLPAARQILRARHATTQAGFTAEFIPKGRLKHHPILISDGPLHDEQRSKVARFFAPAVVADRHHAHLVECAERLLTQACADGTVSLDELALHYSVEVTARIVGLTERPVSKMSRRLVAFFRQPPLDITRADLGRTRWQWLQAAVNGLAPVARFYAADVRPAIRRRRRNPADDVITHLIAEGYTDLDILVECVTYATAGMVTTREFITMAAWHLLENAPLAERYRTADTRERHAILHEIIRLEPPVGHLYRRAVSPIEIEGGDGGPGDSDSRIEPGDLIDLCVRQANADAATVGAHPERLCPGRPLPAGVGAAGLAFGDGAHKCPGQPLAIAETDVLLTRLLAREPTVLARPVLGWDDLIEGYKLRGLRLAVPSRLSEDPARRT